jgi:putative FmdB family regulatory protein
MALYEYQCPACGKRTEKRMPMSDVLQVVPCGSCGKQARKVIGGFAVVGRAEASVGDGPAPWEDGGGADDAGGLDDFGGHGHSHGPGGHTH